MIEGYLSLISPATGLIPVGGGWHISDWPYPTVEHEGEHLTVATDQGMAGVADSVRSRCLAEPGR